MLCNILPTFSFIPPPSLQQLEEDDEEREDMGDIDLWCLSPEDGGRLVVNPKWLVHLQGRLLGEDGHPRKAKVSQHWGLEGVGIGKLITAHHV